MHETPTAGTLADMRVRLRVLANEHPQLTLWIGHNYSGVTAFNGFGWSTFRLSNDDEVVWSSWLTEAPRSSWPPEAPSGQHMNAREHRRVAERKTATAGLVRAAFDDADWLLRDDQLASSPELADLLAGTDWGGHNRWTLALFHVAWQRIPGLRLRAGRGYPVGAEIQARMLEARMDGQPAPDELACWMEVEKHAKKVKGKEWGSKLAPDVFSASLDLLNILEKRSKVGGNHPSESPFWPDRVNETWLLRRMLAERDIAGRLPNKPEDRRAFLGEYSERRRTEPVPDGYDFDAWPEIELRKLSRIISGTRRNSKSPGESTGN